MTDKERQEAKIALNHVYNRLKNEGFLADGVIADYLEKGSPSYGAVEASAWGNDGRVDREDMMTEVLLSYLEKRTDKEISEAGEALIFAHDVMNKAGYDAISQLVGYLLSGDEVYISNREKARSRIRRIDLHDLMTELDTSYFN